jgi:hypothetical protein
MSESGIDKRFRWAVDMGREILGDGYNVIGSSFDCGNSYGVAFRFPDGRRSCIRIMRDQQVTVTPDKLRSAFEAIRADETVAA